MKIKRLEICGFKSFVDRTVVHFPDPITAIVGPNGCGKSNIVDAVRWCMGEQSAKHLRGRAMDDVIFAGSDSRGPAGMCEVSLTFDAGGLARDAAAGGVPWGQVNPDEIVVTRRLHRDGTSEYLLGGVPCRLRDIVDFFLGTGVGTKAYSIIEQGRVGFIVSSKPEDRRTLIDEAAGITKYKAKKRQAERRMDSTRQHLLRVTDILGELDGRLRSLRLQAQKAERYKRYRAELRELDLWEAAHRYLGYLAEEKTASAALGELRAAHDEAVHGLALGETEVEADRLALSGELAELSALRERILELASEAQLQGQMARHKEEEAARLSAQAEAGRRERVELEARLAANQELVQELESSLVTLFEEAGRAEASCREEEHGYEEARAALGEARRALQACSTELATLVAAIARDEAALGATEARAADLEARQVTAAEERARLDDLRAQGERELAALAAALQEALGGLERAGDEAARARQEALGLKEEVARGGVAIETLREEAHRRRSRLQSLREIAARYESFERGVGAIMRQLRAGAASDAGEPAPATDAVPAGAATGWARPGLVRGPVAELVSAPAELEVAVEAVLGQRLGAIVVASQEVGVEAVAYLKEASEGRSSFIPLDLRSPSGAAPLGAREVLYDAGAGELAAASEPAPVTWAPGAIAPELLVAPGVRGVLSAMVECEEQYRRITEYLLGDVLVVERLEDALALWRRHRPPCSLVTLEGDLLDAHGVVTGGARAESQAGVLAQKREIRELEQLVASIETELASANERQITLRRALEEVEARLAAADAARREADLARVGLEKELGGVRRRADEASARLTQLDASARSLQTARDEACARAESLRAALAEARARHGELGARLAMLQGEVEAQAARVDGMVEGLSRLRVTAAQAGERRAAAELSLERARREIGEQRARVARLEEGGSEQDRRAEELRSEAAELRQLAAEKLAQSEAQGKEHAERQEAVEERSGRLIQREDAVRGLRATVQQQSEQLSRLQLRVREAELRRVSLEESVAEKYRDVALPIVVHDYHLRAPVGAAEQARAEELRGLIHRMGEINLTAIEESEELQRRYDYLTAQKADLEAAMEQLETAITKINRASRRRFQEVFDAVNNKFQEVFPRLFRGGGARLVLTNPEDLLETGVDIVANPPGKKMSQNLELLSGGEKALTAVSLLFAIFLVKPSPFCVLDEVDAPLDDVNVTRFAQGITEMTQRSQFIVITHNKQTMEIADRLCGVTMEEPGVSKLVAVQLKGERRGRASIETGEPPAVVEGPAPLA